MSNMEQPQNKNTLQPKIDIPQRKAELGAAMSASLSRSVEAVTGNPSDNPLEVFPNPRSAERRSDVAFDEENVADEVGFRAAMAELGPGRMEDLTPEQAGLSEGYVAVHEAGQSHKLVSQLQVMLESSITPSAVVITASKDRVLPDAEREQTAQVIGLAVDEVGKTEYEVSRQVIRAFGEFMEGDTYELHRYNAAGEVVEGDDASVVLHTEGSLGGIDVLFMEIGREYNEDGTYVQLNNEGKMSAISAALDESEAQIGFYTSATYEPGNKVEALLSEEKTGREAKVVTYGVNRLAAVKGQEPAQPSLSQLAAEAHKVAILAERIR